MNSPTHTLRIAIAQLDFWVGAIEKNTTTILAAITHARDELKADLLVFPELALSGYPPEDLLLRDDFQQRILAALLHIQTQVHGIDVVLTYPETSSQGLHNTAALIRDGQIIAHYQKHSLPNYSVFDEARYFTPGTNTCVVEVKGLPIGIIICEDLWSPEAAQRALADGARLLICPNASPFYLGKQQERDAILRLRIAETQLPIVYANLVGGQDEIIFDGHSLVMDQQGQICQQAAGFTEQFLTFDISFNSHTLNIETATLPTRNSDIATLYHALVLGLRDYVAKNNFSRVLLGLSGGIDSVLTLAIAVDALGKENVHVAVLPSRYTSDLSFEVLHAQLQLLDVKHTTISIEPAFTALLESLAETFADRPTDITEENLQARCRGILLMALSNKFGELVLSTTNKSELAVGYGTLYGDMIGGFAVLKDVFKTQVFALARYRNQQSLVIPPAAITRAPTAELAHDQKDSDSLPSYDILDEILQRYIEQDLSVSEIIAAGFPEKDVLRVVQLIKRNEYKRRQAPPGSKVSSRAFGKDWRYPISSGFFPLL